MLDTLTVTTNAGETITFDGHTGDILHYNDPFFVKHALAFLGVVGIALYFVFHRLRKQWMSTRVDHVTANS